MIANRMERFLTQARRRHKGQTVVAVSHGDPIIILRAKVLGLPLVIESLQGRYYPDKCSVTEFVYAGDAATPEVRYGAPVKDVTAAPKTPTPEQVASNGNYKEAEGSRDAEAAAP